MPPLWRHLVHLLFFCVFTLLVSNTAACFASGLAGCLTFAAATVFSAFTEIASFDCFDMCHNKFLHHNLNKNNSTQFIFSQYFCLFTAKFFLFYIKISHYLYQFLVCFYCVVICIGNSPSVQKIEIYL